MDLNFTPEETAFRDEVRRFSPTKRTNEDKRDSTRMRAERAGQSNVIMPTAMNSRSEKHNTVEKVGSYCNLLITRKFP